MNYKCFWVQSTCMTGISLFTILLYRILDNIGELFVVTIECPLLAQCSSQDVFPQWYR